jgi:peptidoglycan/LPS O-acetylase OafA/YrhL
LNSHVPSRIAGIDLLRTISVFVVILSHYGVWRFELSGTHGVVIFFMVSGYCMAYSTSGRTGKQFLLARFWRLTPAIFVCATITEVVELTLYGINPERSQSFRDYLSNLLCLPNGNLLCDLPFLIIRGTPYSYSWVDGAYWSLLVEIRFYILLWGLHYLLKIKRSTVLIASLGLLATTDLQLPFLSKSTDFFLYLPFFAFGMAYREYAHHKKEAAALMMYSFAIFCFCSYSNSSAISMGLSNENFHTYGACFVFFILTMTVCGNRKSRLLSSLGIISYPLYLLHQDIGLILIQIISWLPPFVGEALVVFVAILGATAVNSLIEKYLPRIRKHLNENFFKRV